MPMLKFQQFKSAFKQYKVKCKTFIQCFEHAECIVIDIFDMLGNEWLNAQGCGALQM